MKHKKTWALASFTTIIALVIVGCAYSWIESPWWAERHELNRIFASSNIAVSKSASQGGDCWIGCPTLFVSLTPQPNTYGGITANLTSALTSHGYALTPDTFRALDSNGNLIKGPFSCDGVGSYLGAVREWDCTFSAKDSTYTITGVLRFPASTKPEVVYKQTLNNGLDEGTDSLPSDTPLNEADLTIAKP